MKLISLVILSISILSCTSNSINTGMTKTEVETKIGKADSIQQKNGIPDVYTNKMIKIETWYFGSDTIINFANDNVQNISILLTQQG